MLYKSMDYFKMPHIIMYSNGEMFDLIKNKQKKVTKQGKVYTTCPFTRVELCAAFRMMYNYYWIAPWSQHAVEPIRELNHIGFPNYFTNRSGDIYSLLQCCYISKQLDRYGYLYSPSYYGYISDKYEFDRLECNKNNIIGPIVSNNNSETHLIAGNS